MTMCECGRIYSTCNIPAPYPVRYELMDGAPRYFYMHGVPINIKFEKPIRCAIVLQFDDIGIKGKNCHHTELFQDWFHSCVSNMN